MSKRNRAREIFDQVVHDHPDLVATAKARWQPKKRPSTDSLRQLRDMRTDALIGSEGHDPRLRSILLGDIRARPGELYRMILREVEEALAGDNDSRVRACRLLRALPVILVEAREKSQQAQA